MNKHLNNFQRNLYKQNYSLNTYEEASKINSFENLGAGIPIESKKNIIYNLNKKEELNNGENFKGENLKKLLTKPKSALFKNLKSVNLNQISHQYPFQKKLLIDTNFEKSELKKSLILEALIEKLKHKNENNETNEQIEEKKETKEKKEKLTKKEILEIEDKDKKSIDKIDKEKNGECVIPKKDEEEKEKEKEGNGNKQHDRERIVIRIVRREKKSKEKKKKEKHQHQAKKEINEEENMSNFKSQNKEKSSMEGEYEEVNEPKQVSKEEKEENDNIKNDGDKNGVIDEFLNEMEKKDINDDKEKNDKSKLDESEDPFTKAENEYRNKNENENMDKKDDLNTNLDKEINELIHEIQNENNRKEDENAKKKEEGKYNTCNTVENMDGKRKDFYQIYLDSLNNENYNSFNPLMNKNRPGDLYLKEVCEYQNNKEMMRNYRKKEKINSFFKKVFSNKYIFKEKPSILLNNSNSREKIGNNALENFKKLLKINLTRNSHKLKQNNYSLKSISNKYLINSFINTSPINKKKNYFKEKYESNGSKLSLHNIIKYILENENEKETKKLNPINPRRCSEPKNKIVDLLNDPYNPYSTIWPNRFLNVNYNMGIHYTDIEQGVPQLKIKNLKNKNLPPLYIRNNLNNNNKSIFHTFSSGFNLNLKSTSNVSNNETSSNDNIINNNNKNNDKISYKGFNLYRNNTEGNNNSNNSKETNIFNKRNLSKINEEGKKC